MQILKLDIVTWQHCLHCLCRCRWPPLPLSHCIHVGAACACARRTHGPAPFLQHFNPLFPNYSFFISAPIIPKEIPE